MLYSMKEVGEMHGWTFNFSMQGLKSFLLPQDVCHCYWRQVESQQFGELTVKLKHLSKEKWVVKKELIIISENVKANPHRP